MAVGMPPDPLPLQQLGTPLEGLLLVVSSSLQRVLRRIKAEMKLAVDRIGRIGKERTSRLRVLCGKAKDARFAGGEEPVFYALPVREHASPLHTVRSFQPKRGDAGFHTIICVGRTRYLSSLARPADRCQSVPSREKI